MGETGIQTFAMNWIIERKLKYMKQEAQRLKLKKQKIELIKGKE